MHYDLQDGENLRYSCCFTDYGGGGLYPTQSSDSGSGTKLAIGVGVAAALVVVFLVGTLVYFLRFVNVMMEQQGYWNDFYFDLRMKLSEGMIPAAKLFLCEFFVPVEKYDYPFNTVDRPRAVLPQFWRSPKIESMLIESWIVESC